MNQVKTKGRFYVEDQLKVNDIINLNQHTSHHIKQVLRAKINDYISVFNEQNGEFLAQITTITKTTLSITIIELIKPVIINPILTKIHLIYAPLKKDATDFLLEKATELGVNEVTQCLSEYTNNKALELDKIKVKMMQATQQCKRLDIPKINATIKFKDIFNLYKNETIYWLNEFKLGEPLSTYLKNNPPISKNIIFIIGAEGGFSPLEKEQLCHSQNIIATYFNGNILKAETAAITALMHYQIFLNNF